jgi:hypothetical protein
MTKFCKGGCGRLAKYNLIIKVKGNGTFNSAKTEDKIGGIKEEGFRVILFGKKEIGMLLKNPDKLLNAIKSENYA